MVEDLNGPGDDAVQRAGGEGSGSTSAAQLTRELLLTLARRNGPLHMEWLLRAEGSLLYLPPDSGGYTFFEAERYMAGVWPEGARNYSKIGPRNRNLVTTGQIVKAVYGTPDNPLHAVRINPENGRPCQVYLLAVHGSGVVRPDPLTIEMRAMRASMQRLFDEDPLLVERFRQQVEVEAQRLRRAAEDVD